MLLEKKDHKVQRQNTWIYFSVKKVVMTTHIIRVTDESLPLTALMWTPRGIRSMGRSIETLSRENAGKKTNMGDNQGDRE